MSAFVLISGMMFRDPETRVAKSGRPFVAATMKVSDSGGEVSWWRVVAFNEAARDELMRLSDGESLAVQGKLGVTTYQKANETRLSFSVVADHVLAARQPKERREPRPKQFEKKQHRQREASGDLLDAHRGDGDVDPRFNDNLPF